ncbi:MAG TPA: PEP/pyruvate-binding domain-containing protein, partial [Oligoflexia bacterium]|nr:PEP/pyruvate-binding domain-containing protein [Oligoflexia bacterium]
MMISHENPVLELAQKYLSLRELLAIRKRMIGTGLIGGKAVGMILARAILKDTSAHWEDVLEPHDSFYVGSDVFYTYLVQNGYWWMVQRLKSSLSIDDATETVRRRILTGEFPEYIVKQFADMLEYFGQSPIIVRSSSIMEDNFGTAFAGKYESVFCANQGGPHKRLEDFLCAVRTVYASTMSEEALTYRSKRSLLGHDEQMGLLIQRVSGASYGHLFFPQAAGVSFSFNPYVWHNSIDPEAGMIRLVFGMGTRAVDRSDDDYTRIVAINEPLRRPESTFDEVRDYAQRRVDVLDLEANHMASIAFEDLLERCREQ